MIQEDEKALNAKETAAQTISRHELTHGNYRDTAKFAQRLKGVVQEGEKKLTHTMKESLDNICTKMGRILSGDPFCIEHWHDIAGYAILMEDQLKDPLKEKAKETGAKIESGALGKGR